MVNPIHASKLMARMTKATMLKPIAKALLVSIRLGFSMTRLSWAAVRTVMVCPLPCSTTAYHAHLGLCRRSERAGARVADNSSKADEDGELHEVTFAAAGSSSQ